jgi:hypothetical protein
MLHTYEQRIILLNQLTMITKYLLWVMVLSAVSDDLLAKRVIQTFLRIKQAIVSNETVLEQCEALVGV